MADLACGWLVTSGFRDDVGAYFAGQGRSVFLGPEVAGWFAAFPPFPEATLGRGSADAERDARALTSLHKGLTVVYFAHTPEALRYAVWRRGRPVCDQKLPPFLGRSDLARKASETFGTLASAWGLAAAVTRGEFPAEWFYAAFPAHQVDLLSYEELASRRQCEPQEARLKEYSFVGKAKTEPFYRNKPAGAAALSLLPVDLRALTQADAWLAAVKRLDLPRMAEPTFAALFDALATGLAFKLAPDRRSLFLELAANALGGGLQHAGEDPVVEVYGAKLLGLLGSADDDIRAGAAQVLKHLPPDRRIRDALLDAMADEKDARVARRLIEAIMQWRHEPKEEDLRAKVRDQDPLIRKGVYAMLEQSVRPDAARFLKACLATEVDSGAKLVLKRVIEAL